VPTVDAVKIVQLRMPAFAWGATVSGESTLRQIELRTIYGTLAVVAASPATCVKNRLSTGTTS
jgi:hypothetical protein